MVPDVSVPQVVQWERRRSLRAAAAVIGLAGLMEFQAPDDVLGAAIVSRVLAVLTMLGLAELHVRAPRLQAHVGTLAGPFTASWVLFQIWLERVHDGPYMAFLPALPLAVMVILQDDVRAVLLSSAILLLGVVGMLWAVDAPALQIAQWGTMQLVMGVLATYASTFFRRLGRLREEAEASQRGSIESELAARTELAAQRAVGYHTERLALVGQLAAGVAHEVNNPLAVVKANLEFLSTDADSLRAGLSAPEYAELLGEMATGVERIRLVVVQLKAFARTPAAVTRLTPLRDVLERALSLSQMRVKPPIVLARELPVGLPEVKVDAERLVHTVVGLVLNSVQALEEHRNGVAPRIEVRARAEAGQVNIEVVDNGPGFPAAVLERLFVPFATTKTEGRGMGLSLALARDFLTSQGGHITADNHPAGGARVRIELPLTPSS